MVKLNNGRLVLGVITIILMFTSIWLGLVSMNSVYQYEWGLNFGKQHLDLAQASTSAETQYQGISQAIICIGTFPKEGNWDYWNKRNPKTNLANAWGALDEIQDYANQTRLLDRNSPAYNIAIYNTQEKIQYFESNYLGGFGAYLDWGLGRYRSWFGVIAAVFWFVFWIITSIWAAGDNDWEALGWVLSSIPLWIAVAFFVWVTISPVLYSGPV